MAGAVVALLVGAVVVLVHPWSGRSDRGAHPAGSVGVTPSASGAPASPSAPAGAVDVPDKGTGKFSFAAGTGAVLGSAGSVRRYRVAVEGGSGQDVAAFAAAVDAVLANPAGWTAGGTVRFQRVPEKSAREVTIFLASPATTDAMCAAGGLRVQKFLSCRLPGQIVLNLARWLTAVPDYGAPLADYRAFALNHEVGRDLGFGNQGCPGPGQPAPVMQQQSLGLDGCAPNPWPYPRGSLYQGRPIP